jgi:tRNA(Ser,Leu) C12 N-acetylase TAN1
MLETWNVLVAAKRGGEGELLEELMEAGEFERSGFSDILIGNVTDIVEFLEDAEEKNCAHLDRVIPIDDSFSLPPGNLMDMLKRSVERYIDEFEPQDSFRFLVEMRGREEQSSRKLENEVSGYFYDLRGKIYGKKPKENRKNPDKLIVIEIVGDRCGIGAITREMSAKYSVIKMMK